MHRANMTIPVGSFVYVRPLLQDMNCQKHRQTNSTWLSVAFTPVTSFHYISVCTTSADTPKHTHVHDSTPPVLIRAVRILPPAQPQCKY